MSKNSDHYLAVVKKIVLQNIPKDRFNVFLFGSRTSKKHRHSSDIDIGIKGHKPIDDKVILKIKEEIDESIVPFKVDIIDFSKVDDKFKKVALKEYEIWNQVKSIKIN